LIGDEIEASSGILVALQVGDGFRVAASCHTGVAIAGEEREGEARGFEWSVEVSGEKPSRVHLHVDVEGKGARAEGGVGCVLPGFSQLCLGNMTKRAFLWM
jgi:hypothetical protein